jgi:[protein-PII] uridylyltransferase
MTSVPSMLPAVLEARRRLMEGRAKAREQHDSGATGLQVCLKWNDVVDSVVVDLIETVVSSTDQPPPPSSYAFVAHSGYGRRDLAPYSDVDIMLMFRGCREEEIAPLARRFAQMAIDAGLQVGFSLRSFRQAFSLSWRDATIFSALAESRFLAGNQEMFDRFQGSFRTSTQRRSHKLIKAVCAARFDERQKFGETVYLLHPNIKRSRGCLRDIQLARWVGYAAYGESDLEQILQIGHLLPEDFKSLRAGYLYLLRLRNQLHFDAGRAQDSLDRGQQLNLAAWAGFHGRDGVLPVEEFMQEYFERTSEVLYASAHFVAAASIGSPFVRGLTHMVSVPVHRYYRLGIREIWANREGKKLVAKDPAKVLELMTLANRFNRRIEHDTWQAIRMGMLRRKPEPLNHESIQRFLDLMEYSPQLDRMLRRLHELRVLEQIIPAMSHARYLLQFNEYHKYTVDAHCIRSIEMAVAFSKQDALLGRVYRGIKNKRILHLALLIHDLGKGFVEDHSEVGKRIAEETGFSLRLSEADRELLVFLVHQHLLMAHSAFRFDLSDPGTIVSFASQVGSFERLQLLFVMSCADIAAVGPGTLNDWKLNLLIQLYEATASQFGAGSTNKEFETELNTRRNLVLKQVESEVDRDWYIEQVEAVPISYLFQLDPAQLAGELKRLNNLSPEKPADAWGVYQPSNNSVRYTVAVQQESPIGLFHHITGALSGQGLEILSAEINTQPGEIAWDRFVVEDPDFQGPPPSARIEEVRRKVLEAIDPHRDSPPVFRRIWKAESKIANPLKHQPSQVRFDNNTSERFSIISIFAYDRTGLLYDISKALYDAKLVLHYAKISTHLDQVVDVFYVNEMDGTKVTVPTRLYTLRQSLLRAVEQM